MAVKVSGVEVVSDSRQLTNISGLDATTKASLEAGLTAVDAATLGGNAASYFTNYTDTAVASLVASAPATLDTLNELAAALGDDPNFATTVTASLATKLPLSGGTMTGDLTFGDNVKTIFGAGSDLQIYHDGSNSLITDEGIGDLRLQSNSTVRVTDAAGTVSSASFTPTAGITLFYAGTPKIATSSTGALVLGDLELFGTVDGRDVAADGTKLDGIESGADVTDAGNVNPLVDTHLNTGTATTGQALLWNGSDYSWGSAGAAALSDLNDVYVANGDIRLRTYHGDDSFYALWLAGEGASGASNIAIGQFAYRNEGGATGVGNINIGQGAGQNPAGTASTAAYNVNLGYQAGYDLSTGSNNFLGGYQAGTNITTGSGNLLVGYDGGASLTTGSYNVFLGQFAGRDVTSNPSNCVAIGQDAFRVGSGTYSVNIGYRAGYNATGSENVAIGAWALGTFTSGETGGEHVAIGHRAGDSLTGAVWGNVLIGIDAGDVMTSGGNNVAIGRNANDTGTTGSNTIVIGAESDPSSATVSNEITLGNSSITRFRIPGAGIDNTSAALSGTTPSVDVGARDTYTLTTSGNTTFTFTGAPSSGQVGTFSLIVTAGGTHTLTWPASVDWAGGTAPDAPASGEKDIYTFMTVDGGTTWYGFLAGDAMA